MREATDTCRPFCGGGEDTRAVQVWLRQALHSLLPPPGHSRDPGALSLPDIVIILVKIDKPKPGIHHGHSIPLLFSRSLLQSKGDDTKTKSI